MYKINKRDNTTKRENAPTISTLRVETDTLYTLPYFYKNSDHLAVKLSYVYATIFHNDICVSCLNSSEQYEDNTIMLERSQYTHSRVQRVSEIHTLRRTIFTAYK